jgi:hypothetical protein
MTNMHLALRLRGTSALAATSLVSLVLLTPRVYAGGFEESNVSPEWIAQLEQAVSHASPREQCFLYAELVHATAEQAGRQIAEGDTEEAAATLQLVNRYAQMLETSIAHDAKRLKNAEELMHHTTYRVSEYLHLASEENKPTVQATLKQLDQVNEELLNQVFGQ